MAVDLFKVDNPLALQEAIRKLPLGKCLSYEPAGGDQVCLFMVKNQVVYYCDLDGRPASLLIREVLAAAGFDPKKIENINKIQRDADLEGGQVPTNRPVSREEAVSRLSLSVIGPTATAGVTVPSGTRMSRMVDTLFRRKRVPEEAHTPRKTPQHKF